MTILIAPVSLTNASTGLVTLYSRLQEKVRLTLIELWGPAVSEDPDEMRQHTMDQLQRIGLLFTALASSIDDVIEVLETKGAKERAVIKDRLASMQADDTFDDFVADIVAAIARGETNEFTLAWTQCEVVGRAECALDLFKQSLSEEVSIALPRRRGETSTQFKVRRRLVLNPVTACILDLKTFLNHL